jgi:hypothetical protein
LDHGIIEKGVGVMFAVYLVFTVLTIGGVTFQNSQLQLMPNLLSAPSIELPSGRNPLQIDAQLLSFNGYFDIFDVIIREDDSPCKSVGCG